MLRRLVRKLGVRPVGGPPRVLVFPSWTENPFLEILEHRARADGYRFPSAVTFHELVQGCRRLRNGDVLHMHWTTPLLQQVATHAEASARLHVLARGMRRAQRRGVNILWTVHNRLPHELRYPDEERSLYRLLSETASAVHTMAPATLDLLDDVVVVDRAKERRIPHPSYEHIYPDSLNRPDARARLGLEPANRAALFFGQIRPYKGVGVLLTGAAAAAAAGAPITVLLAGEVKEMDPAALRGGMPSGLQVTTSLGRVPDEELSMWFRAADLAVLPYVAVLNSGTVHLAATFRLPVILPDEEHLREQFGSESWVAFMDPADPAGSLARLLADPGLFADVDDRAFETFLEPIRPENVGKAYAELLNELTGGLRR